MKCDFCGINIGPSDKYSAYPVPDYTIGKIAEGLTLRSTGNAWAACDICSHYVDREMWYSLKQRAIIREMLTTPEWFHDQIPAIIQEAHDGFISHYKKGQKI